MSKYPNGFRSPLDKSPDSNVPLSGEDTSKWALPPESGDVKHCPTCGQVVKTIFDHLDIDCSSDEPGPRTA